MLGEEPPQALMADEQLRVVEARRGTAGEVLGHRHQGEAGETSGVDRVQDDAAPGAKDATELAGDGGQVRDVLEDLPGHDDGGGVIGQREVPRIAADGLHPLHRRGAEGRHGEVDADVDVAIEVPGHEATAAADVDEHLVRGRRPRDERAPDGGQPVEGGKPAFRPPPLVDEVVVLPQVVAGPGRCELQRFPGCFRAAGLSR